MYQILAYLCKPDFQAKTSGYMKEIIRTLDEGEEAWKKQVRKFELEILEEACYANPMSQQHADRFAEAKERNELLKKREYDASAKALINGNKSLPAL